MFGSLIPCDGGPPIGLTKPKLALRLRSQSAGLSGAGGESRAELLFTDGLWSVIASADGPGVKINDAPCERGRLMPDDILTVGRHRYRINYQSPQSAASTPTTPIPPAAIVAPAPVPPTRAPISPMDSPVLGMLIPSAGGRAMMLRKQKLIVGRVADCDIVLANRIVSSRHCELQFNGGHWQVVDLDSRNGTFVDGMGYRQKWLFPGDILGIATLRFRLEYVPQGERPSAAEDDIPVISRKSLMECVGLTDAKLDALTKGISSEEPNRRWRIDDT